MKNPAMKQVSFSALRCSRIFRPVTFVTVLCCMLWMIKIFFTDNNMYLESSSVIHSSYANTNSQVFLNSFQEHMLLPRANAEEIKLPTIYVITPTYPRPEQVPELVRLGQTLLHVKYLKWLVVEDSKVKNNLVTQTLESIGVPFEHLMCEMPEKYRTMKGARPSGVANRNVGLEWVRKHATEGVIYFADDDNTYHLDLFKEMRYTKKVSMWPVGLVTQLGVSTPIVDSKGKITGFYDGFLAGRKFPVDMAGFAVSVELLFKFPDAIVPFTPCHEEDQFLKSLHISNEDIELKADMCTKILVWHTQSKKNYRADVIDIEKYKHTNLIHIKKYVVQKPEVPVNSSMVKPMSKTSKPG